MTSGSTGRSIPACAGEPVGEFGDEGSSEVYPRVCGGTDGRAQNVRGLEGLSPRVRGNPGHRRRGRPSAGSIPACAGEPAGYIAKYMTKEVYPRVCGGTCERCGERIRRKGLSPRVRGNRGVVCDPCLPSGSIPACAGEPIPSARWYSLAEVYPRVCGGTDNPTLRQLFDEGLSPRVRGNHRKELPSSGWKRSIPACAGEPGAVIPPVADPAVYPRVCGGTVRTKSLESSIRGLSPRVRGNRKQHRLSSHGQWSIPACAGEPGGHRCARPDWGVYPRVCGGTYNPKAQPLPRAGLSPRVRGNLLQESGAATKARSIPACAGEPWPSLPSRIPRRVYPRVCGGTGCRWSALADAPGLSPRVRGNHYAPKTHTHPERSIPACAGEPARAHPRATSRGVYPRVCGGTTPTKSGGTAASGLSPRVRGNLPGVVAGHRRNGSIPACAGEPIPIFSASRRRKVYPRVCGGTG